MSRLYRMSVEISQFDPQRIAEIKAAAAAQWPFSDDWLECEGSLQSDGESQLCAGESEKEFTERLTKSIWRANGAYCQVAVGATYLEELPYESHCLNEEDYARLISQSHSL